MIRLQPSGIDISQKDLDFHLQQLDIYQGLLKQGFKKHNVIKYFRDQNAKKGEEECKSIESPSTVFSTYELCTKAVEHPDSGGSPSLVDKEMEETKIRGQHQSQSVSPERLSDLDQGSLGVGSPSPLPKQRNNPSQAHAPRQSSLLRFAQGVSSNGPKNDQSKLRIPFSPASNMRYRPRSETYSYDQSEMDEDDLKAALAAPRDELEHLTLDQELVPTSADSVQTTIRLVSNLRPEADTFTPLHMRHERGSHVSICKAKRESSSSSDDRSLPSSPPLLPLNRPRPTSQRSPSLPRLPRTPPVRKGDAPETAHRTDHQQYLDGSFTVYDDTLPAQLQPQTPADLSRGPALSEYNAAYTAPPGMIRSPLPLQGRYMHGARQPSGDLSPTTRAQLIRERRQREFMRVARIEGLRIDRIREFELTTQLEQSLEEDELWREDLDADGVGEEKFDDATLIGAVRRLRVVSGNRRIP